MSVAAAQIQAARFSKPNLKDGVCRTPYDGHTLPEALEQCQHSARHTRSYRRCKSGCRGVEVPGTRILRSGQRRGITKGLKAMIKHRSAIEPTVAHNIRRLRFFYALVLVWPAGRLNEKHGMSA